MKRFVCFLILACLLLPFGASAQQGKMIKTKVPKRPAGQQDALLLTAPPMETVRVGFIGLGMRGPDAVERFAQIESADIKGCAMWRPTAWMRAKSCWRNTASMWPSRCPQP